MSDHREKRTKKLSKGKHWFRPVPTSRPRGQALIEYALILTLIVLGTAAVFALTGPAVADVFENQVYNLLEGDVDPRATLSADEFWTQVAAVASFTPFEPDVSTNVPVPPTDVPPPPTDMPDQDNDGVPDIYDACKTIPGQASAAGCPDEDGDGFADFEDNCPSVPGTIQGCPPTPGPSPTPEDEEYTGGLDDDAEDPDNWQPIDLGNEPLPPFEDPLEGTTWNAEFWSLRYADVYYSTTRRDQSIAAGHTDVPFDQSDYSLYPPDLDWAAFADGSGDWQTTYDSTYDATDGAYEIDRSWSGQPNAAVQRNFIARFKATVELQDRPYTVRVRKSDGARIWIGGQLVVDEWWYQPEESDLFTRDFQGTAGEQEVVIELADSGGTARIRLQILDNAASIPEVGECYWALSGEAYRSPSQAWSDSPGMPYESNTNCALRLRGTVDLRASTAPKLEFWDRYDLGPNVHAKIEVSEFETDVWTAFELHTNETNLGWTRETIDLSPWADPDGTGALTGKIIELRLVLDARNVLNSGAHEGWWVDDIKIEEDVIKTYTIGFADDMESALHWYAGGSWARTNESPRSGSQTWSDSPGANYIHGTNSTLELDGYIDLTDPAVGAEPLLTFWHKYNLVENDSIIVEFSTDKRVTWPARTILATSTTNLAWTYVEIPLKDFIPSGKVYFRFRLDATSDSSVADGWWIDDFWLRNKDVGVIRPADHVWCDNGEGGIGNWIPNGTWNAVSGTDTNLGVGRSVSPHSGGGFFSDSPASTYLNNSDSALELARKVDLEGTTNPELVFWHQWALVSPDDIHVEVFQDGDTAWTDIWSFHTGGRPATYPSSPDLGYNHHMGWIRESVSLKSYATGANKVIYVRFRLKSEPEATPSVDDGWWLDDVCFQERSIPVYSLPFVESFESDPTRWYLGGNWELVAGSEHRDGNAAVTDSPIDPINSPEGYYQPESDGILELKGALDLRGTTWPTLYFWDTFQLEYQDYLTVEVQSSTDNGATWSNWTNLLTDSNSSTSWNREQYNLNSYAGRLLRLRFRLYTDSNPAVWDGAWLDGIQVIERFGAEAEHPADTFLEDAESVNNFWVADGDWAIVPGGAGASPTTGTDLGSGSALGPTTWHGEYYTLPSGYYPALGSLDEVGTLVGTSEDAEINFNWGSGAPSQITDRVDDYGIRWTRTVTLPQDGWYEIQTGSDDGILVYIDGNLVTNAWYARGYSWIAERNYAVLTAGDHTVVVEYYERGGSARVRLGIATVQPFSGHMWHDSPGGYYEHNSNASLTLEGTIDTSGLSSARLYYTHMFDFGSGDVGRIELSKDGGHSWTTIWNYTGTDLTWRTRSVSLPSGFLNQKINIRFRVDARVDSSVGDGWYLDDIMIVAD